ncbi:hypothetical protein KAX22_07170, partial [bacterium]|nr:hypothetical protein [bacterium]
KALDFISALGRLVRKEAADMAPVLRPLRRLYTVDSGDIVKVVKEMIEVLSSIDLEMYVNCSTLRKYWGVPNHYIILRRWNDHFE